MQKRPAAARDSRCQGSHTTQTQRPGIPPRDEGISVDPHEEHHEETTPLGYEALPVLCQLPELACIELGPALRRMDGKAKALR